MFSSTLSVGEVDIIPAAIKVQHLVITSGTVDKILTTGTYSLTFDFSDIAHNYLDGVIVNLDITT